jgi:hypothetical protein
MLITHQVATAPCTDPVQARLPTFETVCGQIHGNETPVTSSHKLRNISCKRTSSASGLW